MAYVLTEEQQLLKDSASDLFKTTPVAKLRELRDSRDPLGYSAQLWSQMVDLGFPGLAIAEEYGGLGFGVKGLGIIMQEAGRTLSASPLLSVAVANHVIAAYGAPTLQTKLQEVIVEGHVTALGIQEGDFYHPNTSQTSFRKEGDKYVINGTKDLVADAHVAQYLIINASDQNGQMTVFFLEALQDGVTRSKELMMDSRYYSKVQLSDVIVDENHIVGNIGAGKKVVSSITDLANALLSAELLGLSLEAFERTVSYLKERSQFGVAIGSFQALQHRAAHLYGELELAVSISSRAIDTLDLADISAPAICSAAKAKCAEVSRLATNEGIQMYGGIGMTDDEEIGFFLKRARVAAQQFGARSYHLNRYASLNGF